MAGYIRRVLKGAEFPAIREDDPKVRELRDITRRLPHALDEVFQITENPRQCSVVHMAVAHYLREHGFRAEVTPAIYLGRHNLNREEFGADIAGRSRLYSNLLATKPVHQRNPKRYAAEVSKDEDQMRSVYQHLYLATDTFVSVDMGGRDGQSERYIIHAAYRQFLPEKERESAPPIILDRVDAYKLRKKYKLAVTSPEHARVTRDIESVVFAGEDLPVQDENMKALRAYMREQYARFKGIMDGGAR